MFSLSFDLCRKNDFLMVGAHDNTWDNCLYPPCHLVRIVEVINHPTWTGVAWFRGGDVTLLRSV